MTFLQEIGFQGYRFPDAAYPVAAQILVLMWEGRWEYLAGEGVVELHFGLKECAVGMV